MQSQQIELAATERMIGNMAPKHRLRARSAHRARRSILPFVFCISLAASSITVLGSIANFSSPPAQALSANPSITSTGYIYSANSSDTGIQRYSLTSGKKQELNMSDSTCQALDRNRIWEIAVDATRGAIYWTNTNAGPNSNYRTQLNELNLKSGICRNLVQETGPKVSNSDFYFFTGLHLDEVNQRIFYVDQGGAKTVAASAEQGQNRSLRYFDLNQNLDHKIMITNTMPNKTIGYAADVVVEGNFAYVVSQQYLSPNNLGTGDSIFKVQVVDNNNSVVNSAVPVELINWGTNNGPSTYQLAKFGSEIVLASMDESRLTKFTIGSGTAPEAMQVPIFWQGFALGQNGEIFTMDGAASPRAWVGWQSINSAQSIPLSGESETNYSYWSLPTFDSREFPAAPVITNVSATNTSTVVHFNRPLDYDLDGNYEIVATPVSGSGTVNATCLEDGTGTCEISGLAAGDAYNFRILHNWKNSSGLTIVTSNYSPDYLYSPNFPIINDFDVYENTVNRYTYRSQHQLITAENVDESVVPWVSGSHTDEDLRSLSGATEYITFSWFLCDSPQSQSAVSHSSFSSLANDCTDVVYSDLYSYADQGEIGKYTTLGVHAKNIYGETFTLQSRSTANASEIIFGAEVRNTGGLVPGGSLVTYLEDVLSGTWNPVPVDSILEKLSDFRTRTTQNLVQSWYRCPSDLPVQFQVGGTSYPASNQVPANCVNLNETSDTHAISAADQGSYVISKITLNGSTTQVVATFVPAAATPPAPAPSVNQNSGGSSSGSPAPNPTPSATLPIAPSPALPNGSSQERPTSNLGSSANSSNQTKIASNAAKPSGPSDESADTQAARAVDTSKSQPVKDKVAIQEKSIDQGAIDFGTYISNLLAPKQDMSIGAPGSSADPGEPFSVVGTLQSSKRYMEFAAWFMALFVAAAIGSARSMRSSKDALAALEVDSGIQNRRQNRQAWGDRLPIFKLKAATFLDEFSVNAIRVTNPRIPVLANIFNDGSYLRSIFGSLTMVGAVASAALGVYAAVSREANSVVPAVGLLALIVLVGVFDSFNGLLATFALIVTTLITLQNAAINDYRTVVGLFILGFAPALAAEAFRSLRRKLERNSFYIWERICDFAIAPFIGSVSTYAFIAILPALAGQTLEVSNYAGAFGIGAAAAMILRVALEEFATRLYPARMDVLNPVDLEDPTLFVKLMGIVFKLGLYVFIATSIFGIDWQIWLSCAIFLLPSVLQLVEDRLPNSKSLWRVLPKGIPGMAVSLVVSISSLTLISMIFTNPADLAKYGFALISIPAILLLVIHLFGRHGHEGELKPVLQPQRRILYRAGGVGMFAATVLLTSIVGG